MKYLLYTSLLFGLLSFYSCEKLLNVSQPASMVDANKVFEDNKLIEDALMSIYRTVDINNSFLPYLGLYTDEYSTNSQLVDYQQYLNNALTPETSIGILPVWRSLYSVIYQANALEEGITFDEKRLSTEAIRRQLLGEALFLRAYAYFMLVNLWGDVPLITASDVNASSVSKRASQQLVYDQINKDLASAASYLENNDSGTKIRTGYLAVKSLMARVFLYQQNWKGAKDASGFVIEKMPNLSQGIDAVFQAGYFETILELWKQNGVSQGSVYIPTNVTLSPTFFLRNELLSSFELDDERIGKYFTRNNTGSYFPYKYKQRVSGSIKEYDILFRLPEIYLINAEANFKLNKMEEARLVLNQLRTRCKLSPLAVDISDQHLFEEILQERYRELFGEGGHRFFDLKRLGRIDERLEDVKGNWNPDFAVFPVPMQEIILNKNLDQNIGYY